MQNCAVSAADPAVLSVDKMNREKWKIGRTFLIDPRLTAIFCVNDRPLLTDAPADLPIDKMNAPQMFRCRCLLRVPTITAGLSVQNVATSAADPARRRVGKMEIEQTKFFISRLNGPIFSAISGVKNPISSDDPTVIFGNEKCFVDRVADLCFAIFGRFPSQTAVDRRENDAFCADRKTIFLISEINAEKMISVFELDLPPTDLIFSATDHYK